LNLHEAISLIDDIEESFEESKATDCKKTIDLPKLYIMESFQSGSEGYTLCIKKTIEDNSALNLLQCIIKKKGLSITSLCEKYWVIYTSKF
jgi:hypothetical protein